MAATTKKKKVVRKSTEKQYSWVSFPMDIFEGEFILPDMKHLKLNVVDALNKGNVGVLADWLKEAKVDEDYIEALWELEQGEVQDFVAAWGQGSLVDAPKSKD